MELAPLMSDVHHLLKALDPAVVDTRPALELQQRLGELSARLQQGLATWDTQAHPIRDDANARGAAENLHRVLSTASAPLTATGKAATPHYEALAQRLRHHGVRAESLHPTNLKRTFFHVASGVAVVAAVHLFLTRPAALWLSGVCAALLWTVDLTRRHVPWVNQLFWKMIQHVAREHERYRPNSSTWFTTGLFIIALTAFDACGMLGILTLAVGDPSAAAVGRRWGRIRLMRGRTLEGSVAFVVTSVLVGVAYLAIIGPHPLGARAYLLPVAAALGGAVAEAISTRLDDNLTVPVVAAWTALALQTALG